jgi:putative 4-mercaptohistidine N1-methyltranferase
MSSAIYESERLLSEYLLFHYGAAEDVLPYGFGPRDAVAFPARCVAALLPEETLPAAPRALDVGCAVGRSSFELARCCHEVVGVDFSRSFIAAAQRMKSERRIEFERRVEGDRTARCVARVPSSVERARVRFETGDAMDLRSDLGVFDVVLAANLLCRLREPARFLQRVPELVRPGGALLLTTPCTWLEEFTPREHWLCQGADSTLDGLHRRLDPFFRLERTLDLPFIIREHERKYQWTVAQGTTWIRLGADS